MPDNTSRPDKSKLQRTLIRRRAEGALEDDQVLEEQREALEQQMLLADKWARSHKGRGKKHTPAEIFAQFEEIERKHPSWKRKVLYRLTGAAFNLSGSTVQRHIAKLVPSLPI